MMMQWVTFFCRGSLASLCLSNLCFLPNIFADSNAAAVQSSVVSEDNYNDYSIEKRVDDILDYANINDKPNSDLSDDGANNTMDDSKDDAATDDDSLNGDFDSIDDISDDSNVNVASDSDKNRPESMDASLKITEPPRILSSVLCVPDDENSEAESDYPARLVLLGPLNRTQGRELISEIRKTRRPSSFNAEFFDFLKEQREEHKSIRACCHAQHCNDGQYCHVLVDAVSLSQGIVVSVCVSDKIDP